jgi:hypothetical protein
MFDTMLVRKLEEDGYERECKHGGIDVCDEVRLRKAIIRKHVLAMSAILHSLSGCGEQHTLAKKFEAVHKNTVTRRRKIPKDLLATFASPTPALKPCGFKADREEDIESRS